MDIKNLLNVAIGDKVLVGNDRDVLAKLCHRAKRGIVKVTKDQIAAHLEIDRRTVQRSLRRLEKLRLIELLTPGGFDNEGRKRPSAYRLFPELN